MKHFMLVFLVIGAIFIFFTCSEKNPSAPGVSQSDQVINSLAKPHLTGTIELTFALDPNNYFWKGTITIDGVIYDMQFKSVGNPPPPPPRAFVFAERFEIYEGGFLGDPDHLLMEGADAGVVPCGNDKFVANGIVEIANEPFEMWLGRNVHTNGVITWVIPCNLPAGGTGTFRIN